MYIKSDLQQIVKAVLEFKTSAKDHHDKPQKKFLKPEPPTYIKVSPIWTAIILFSGVKIILLYLMLEAIIKFPLLLIFLSNKFILMATS